VAGTGESGERETEREGGEGAESHGAGMAGVE
jgi:hypothetical protein